MWATITTACAYTYFTIKRERERERERERSETPASLHISGMIAFSISHL